MTQPGTFSYQIFIKPNYICTYRFDANGDGTTTSSTKTFIVGDNTSSIPSVSSQPATEILSTTSTLNGYIVI